MVVVDSRGVGECRFAHDLRRGGRDVDLLRIEVEFDYLRWQRASIDQAHLPFVRKALAVRVVDVVGVGTADDVAGC